LILRIYWIIFDEKTVKNSVIKAPKNVPNYTLLLI